MSATLCIGKAKQWVHLRARLRRETLTPTLRSEQPTSHTDGTVQWGLKMRSHTICVCIKCKSTTRGTHACKTLLVCVLVQAKMADVLTNN